MQELDSKVFGGTMLVAGTSIGAAMLAMPIMTGLFGMWGTFAIMIICWLLMYWTATIMLESLLRFESGASFLTMARATLGKFGAGFTWVVYLLLFYSLVAAYLKGSGHIMIDALETWTNIELPAFFDILPLLVVFAPFIYFGLSVVDRLNRYLMLGMLISYVVIILWLFPHMNLENLNYTSWDFSLLSFSVVVTSFGYHVIIPTLMGYLNRDINSIKKCLFYGSFIPLIAYFFWELTILGSVPVGGTNGLAQAFNSGMPLARLLRMETGSDFVALLSRAFSIFAIITSFLGVAQGLFDFLKDGIKAGNSHKKRILAFLLTFVPPVILIIGFEAGFIALLEYAGAFVAIILGIIPILIVWRLRVQKTRPSLYHAPGANLALILGLIFFAFVAVLVLLKNLGFIVFGVESLI